MKRVRGAMSFAEASAPFAAMIVLFLLGALRFDTGPATIIVAMLGAAAVAGISVVRVGAGWADIEHAAGARLAATLPVILILLSIGALIGTWMLSGTIPYLVAFGLRIVSPEHLVLTAFLATALMSIATGTSWGSAGTIGVAMMGMAAALDAPLAIVAGAVVSGAYFGDKLSPLSDTTNIAAISVGIPLYRHIRHLLYTAVPSFIVAVIVYFIVGGASGEASGKAAALIAEIDRVYGAPLLAMLPPIVVVGAVVARIPPALGIALSSLVAGLIGIFAQGFSVADAVQSSMRGLDAATIAETANASEAFVRLVERGGVYPMAETLIVILAAFILAGAMEASGALDALVRTLLAAVRSTASLIAATAAASAMVVALISHSGVTSLLVGGLFKDAYLERGLAEENLSRTLEDSAAITEPLMPWTVSAVYMASVVGVPTADYAPWALFCWTGALFTLLYGAAFERTGFGLKRVRLTERAAAE